jgi:hypothetical protein
MNEDVSRGIEFGRECFVGVLNPYEGLEGLFPGSLCGWLDGLAMRMGRRRGVNDIGEERDDHRGKDTDCEDTGVRWPIMVERMTGRPRTTGRRTEDTQEGAETRSRSAQSSQTPSCQFQGGRYGPLPRVTVSFLAVNK